MNKLRTTELLLAHINNVVTYDLSLVASDCLVTLQKNYHEHIKYGEVSDINSQFLNGIRELNNLMKDMVNDEVYSSISKIIESMRESEFYGSPLYTDIPFMLDLIQQLALALNIEHSEKYHDTDTFVSISETLMDNLDILYNTYGLPSASIFTRDIFSEFMHKSPIFQISTVLLNLRELIALALPQQKSEMVDGGRATIKEALASINLFLLEAIDIDTLGKANESTMMVLLPELIYLVYLTLEELAEGLYANKKIPYRVENLIRFADIVESMDVISFIFETVFIDNKSPYLMMGLQNAIDDAFSAWAYLSTKYSNNDIDFGILSESLRLIDTITTTLYGVRMENIRQSTDKTDKYWLYTLVLEDKSLHGEPNDDEPQTRYDVYIKILNRAMSHKVRTPDKYTETAIHEMGDTIYGTIKQICKSGK